ncbi:MAG: hypothetical protein KAY37_02930 [Phycisphaerae bacterium]|nr:hypothetical protein [Phycisphaerae bacterium]
MFAVAASADTPTSQPGTAESGPPRIATSQPAQVDTAPAPKPADEPAGPKSLLRFNELSFDLGFEGAYDQHDTRFDISTPLRRRYRQSNRTRRFEETLGLHGSGVIVDERTLLFDAAGRWGLSQEWFRETRPGPDLRRDPHGDLLEYDFGLTLFPRGKLSATGYAQRLDSRIPRAFQPSLDRTRERYGGDVFFSDPRLPMRLSFEHIYDELSSRTGNLLDDERRGRDSFRYEATWQIDQRHSLRLEYEYDDRREQYSGSNTRFDTTRNYVTLNHILRFGDQGRSSWETLARFQDETGDLARDNVEVSTRLRLQHTDALATNYAAQFLRDSFQELSTRAWRGEAGLTHQLGDSLTTTVQLYGLRQNADGSSDFTEGGGLANVAFNRENRLGRFSANLSYNHVATDTNDGNRRGIVIAESVTFRDPLSSYLVHTDVDLVSLVITDANRSRTYLAGRDYTAVRLGRYTALRRVATGQITDRQTVLVSYTYQVFSDYDVTRDRIDWRVQQAFKCGLTPYYAASIQNESLDKPRYLSFRARNVNRHRVGATYRQKRWSLGLEYEYNDDAIDPYQALHFNGDVVLWQSARHQLDGKGTLSRFRFDGSDGLAAHDTTLLDLGTTYRYLLARNLEANAGALYRYEDDSLFGLTHGVDLTAALDWKIGHFSLRFEAEYDVLDLPDSRDDSASFWIKLKRDIPVLARRS